MIYYLVLTVGAFLTFSVLFWKRLVFHKVAEGSIGLVNELLGESADEDLLIKQIQASTNILLLDLLKMLLVVILAFVLGSLPIIIFIFTNGINFSEIDLSSFYSILAISIGASLPFFLPFSKKSIDGYSELSKLLHRMILDSYNVAMKLFNVESRKLTRSGAKTRTDFVIVSGLARAGTTSLMTDLSKISDFVSLSYANMPFLTSPNLWRKIYKPKQAALKERSHKDGIMIGYNSTEALEEYFFKMLANDSFINEEYLTEYEISKEDYEHYLTYQRNIKNDNKKIYLAKNNNFLLRYRSLRELNNDFLLFILFRDPLTHAASLMEKHRDYIKLQKDDNFVIEYMDWLGHHEFGLHQKQFVFNGSTEIVQGDRDNLDYWLQIWINYYSNTIKIDHPNTIFIDYQEYCSNPSEIISMVLERAGVKANIIDLKPFKNNRKSELICSKELLNKAQNLYSQLQKK